MTDLTLSTIFLITSVTLHILTHSIHRIRTIYIFIIRTFQTPSKINIFRRPDAKTSEIISKFSEDPMSKRFVIPTHRDNPKFSREKYQKILKTPHRWFFEKIFSSIEFSYMKSCRPYEYWSLTGSADSDAH